MKRRDVLKCGVASAAFLGGSGIAKASDSVKPTHNLKVCFKHGVHSFATPEGGWHLWVRADPRKLKSDIVRLKLEVSTDPDFLNVIAEERHEAKREKSYILRTKFHSPIQNSELYFRFVAIDTFKGEFKNIHFPQPRTSAVGKLVAFA